MIQLRKYSETRAVVVLPSGDEICIEKIRRLKKSGKASWHPVCIQTAPHNYIKILSEESLDELESFACGLIVAIKEARRIEDSVS